MDETPKVRSSQTGRGRYKRVGESVSKNIAFIGGPLDRQEFPGYKGDPGPYCHYFKCTCYQMSDTAAPPSHLDPRGGQVASIAIYEYQEIMSSPKRLVYAIHTDFTKNPELSEEERASIPDLVGMM